MNALTRIPETLVLSVAFAVTGLLTFLLCFWIVDKLTPGDLWKELVQNKNTAVAQFFGFIALGMSIIIAAAIHG
jgi:uncharacterized membrane protein YjfL (UPF0719 family)